MDRGQRTEFETEKQEVKQDIDRRELESQQDQRVVKNRVIDLEVEAKRFTADKNRIIELREREISQSNERMEDLNIELRQIEHQKINFRQEMQQTELELRAKLDVVEEQSRELSFKETALQQ